RVNMTTHLTTFAFRPRQDLARRVPGDCAVLPRLQRVPGSAQNAARRGRTTAMRHLLSAVAICATLSAATAAQTVSVQDNALKDWTSQRDTLVKIANAMPEDKFGFRPTPAQRTWGEQILHIAQANVVQMGRLGGRAAAPDVNMKATSRAEILKALSDSFDFGTAVLQEQSDAAMVQQAASTRFDQF